MTTLPIAAFVLHSFPPGLEMLFLLYCFIMLRRRLSIISVAEQCPAHLVISTLLFYCAEASPEH